MKEERSIQDWESADQQWRHRENINPTCGSSYESWISFEMPNCGSCFLWSCSSSKELMNYYVSNVFEWNKEAKKCVSVAEIEMQMKKNTPLSLGDRLGPAKT